MTWFSPATLAVEGVRSVLTPVDQAVYPAAHGLGAAVAGPCTWDTTRAEDWRARPAAAVAQFQSEGVRLRAPRDILSRMAGAAGALGRSESDVWVEAAREWLLRHAPESPTGGQPALSGAGAFSPIGSSRSPISASPNARRTRVWRDIDGVLASLREQSSSRRGAPGAA